jgi:hypothetical protein
MVLVFVRLRPGVTTEKYAQKHDRVDLNRRRARVAKKVEDEFRRLHRVANVMVCRAGGFSLWVAGLCLVIVSSPHAISPQQLRNVLIGIGLGIQLFGTVLFDFWGIWLSRSISKAVHVTPDD